MRPPTFGFSVSQHEGTAFVLPEGDLDLANHKMLEGALVGVAMQESVEAVYLDLSKVRHFDASSIGSVIRGCRYSTEKCNKKFRIGLPRTGCAYLMFSCAGLLSWQVVELIEEGLPTS